MKYLLFLTLLTACCGQPYSYRYETRVSLPTKVDPEFQPFVDGFVNWCPTDPQIVDNLIVYFHTKFPKAKHSGHVMVGMCSGFGSDTPRVTIRPSWWYRSYRTDSERMVLIYHELGHCLLQREHTEDKMTDSKCPNSLMYPTLSPILKCWDAHADHYLKELCSWPE